MLELTNGSFSKFRCFVAQGCYLFCSSLAILLLFSSPLLKYTHWKCWLKSVSAGQRNQVCGQMKVQFMQTLLIWTWSWSVHYNDPTLQPHIWSDEREESFRSKFWLESLWAWPSCWIYFIEYIQIWLHICWGTGLSIWSFATCLPDTMCAFHSEIFSILPPVSIQVSPSKDWWAQWWPDILCGNSTV